MAYDRAQRERAAANRRTKKGLAILLVVGVAGGFELFGARLGLFDFAFINELQRAVNLAYQRIETVAEIFHFRAVSCLIFELRRGFFFGVQRFSFLPHRWSSARLSGFH